MIVVIVAGRKLAQNSTLEDSVGFAYVRNGLMARRCAVDGFEIFLLTINGLDPGVCGPSSRLTYVPVPLVLSGSLPSLFKSHNLKVCRI